MALKIAAHAKINLTLYITGKREDGYHTLNTIMQSLSLADIITLELNNTGVISVECDNHELAGDRNLAYKAAYSFLSVLNEKKIGVRIFIEKHIPLAAGLGGGSADAAAVLAGLNLLFHEPLTINELLTLALPLGADVPFCLVGGTCLATGIGEKLQSLPDCPDWKVLLIKPCDKASTGEMYQKYDENNGLSAVENCVIIDGIGAKDLALVAKNLYNDFQPLYEGQAVSDALLALKNNGALGASLSGSGPTVFGLFDDELCSMSAFEQLKQTYSACAITQFSARGWHLIEKGIQL